MLLHVLVLYSEKLGMPYLSERFGMASLSRQNWLSILKWSAPILVVEEILKMIGRNRNKKYLRPRDSRTHRPSKFL